MRKIFTLFIALMMLLPSITAKHALGNPKAPNNVARILDVPLAYPGATITVSLEIENDDPFVGFQFDIELPVGFTYVPGSAVLNEDRALAAHELGSNVLEGNILRLLGYSSPTTAFEDPENDFEILTLQLEVGSDVAPGLYPLSFTGDAVIGDSSADNILTNVENGVVTVNHVISFFFLPPGWDGIESVEVWGPFAHIGEGWTGYVMEYDEQEEYYSASVLYPPLHGKSVEVTYQIRIIEGASTKFQKSQDDEDPTFTTSTGEIWIDGRTGIDWNVGGDDNFFIPDEFITETQPVDPVDPPTPIDLFTVLDKTGDNYPAAQFGTNVQARSAAIYQERYVIAPSRFEQNNVWVWDMEDPNADPVTLNMGTGIVSGGTFPVNYVQVVGDHIYVSNMRLADNPASPFRVYRWTSLEATPEVVLSVTGELGRLGDAFSILGDPSQDGHIIAHINSGDNGQRKFHKWNFEGGVLQNETTPEEIEVIGVAHAMNSYGVINPIEGETDLFVTTGNNMGVAVIDITGDVKAYIGTDIMNPLSYDPRIFYYNDKRYLSVTINNFAAGGLGARLQILDISNGSTVVEAIGNISDSNIYQDRLVVNKQFGPGNGFHSSTNSVIKRSNGELLILPFVVNNGFILESTQMPPVVYEEVTFNVNMALYAARGDFNPDNGDFMELMGGFNGWTDPVPMTDDNGDLIYSVTIDDVFEAGEEYLFKFRINNAAWDDPWWEEGDNRSIEVVAGENIFTDWFNREAPVSATIDKDKLFRYQNWDTPNQDIEITWNDANVVTGVFYRMEETEEWQELPSENYTVIEIDDDTATLTILFSEMNWNGEKNTKEGGHQQLQFTALNQIRFDLGDPADLQTEVFAKTFFLTFDIEDEDGDPVPGAVLTFTTFDGNDNEGTIHDDANDPVFEVWARGDYHYMVEADGFFTQEGTILNVEADQTFTVVLEVDPGLAITSVEELDAIEVAYGTELSDIVFPATVEVTLEDETTATLDVTWDNGTPPYDGEAAGNYVFEGTLTIVDGMYNPEDLKAAITVVVNKGVPVVSVWPTAGNITYGDALSASSIDDIAAQVDVDGTFAFTNPELKPAAGTGAFSMTFTPDDTDNFEVVVTEEADFVEVIVEKFTATIIITGLIQTFDGDPKPVSVNVSPANNVVTGDPLTWEFTVTYEGIDGTTYDQSTDAPADEGLYMVTVTIDMDNYQGTATATLEINDKVTPLVTWPEASPITIGQTLEDVVLTGGSAVYPDDPETAIAGTFAFAEPDFEPQQTGVISVLIVFTPDDTDEYNSVTDFIEITVNPVAAVVTQWPVASNITYGQPLSGSELTGGEADVDGTFDFEDSTLILPAGEQEVVVVFTPDDESYMGVSSTITIVVETKVLTIGGSFTAFDKPFDGTVDAEVDDNSLELIGVVGEDDVVLADVVVVFASEVVGHNVTVTIASATLSGDDAANYTLSLEDAPVAFANIFNIDADILGFELAEQTAPAVFEEQDIAIEVVFGTDVTTLSPTITLSQGATVAPEGGVPTDFTDPVTYTVTAEDGVTTKEWVVTVTIAQPPLYTLTLAASPEAGGTVDGEGDYSEGEEVNVSAVANTGYLFVNWTNGDGAVVSEEAAFVYTMPAADVTLTANFEVDDTPDPIFITEFPWLEDFEGEAFPPEGWASINAQGADRQWVLSTAQNHTPEGSQSAFHDYGAQDVMQEGWLITPGLVIPDEGEYELSFWSFNTWPNFYDKNSVWISTGSSNPEDGDFEEVWFAESVTQAWVQTVLSLADYAGETIFVAFIYEGDFAHGWHLDDVGVSLFVEPEFFTLTLEANPAEGGTVSGAGEYEAGETVAVDAVAADGFEFVNWTNANGDVVSTDASFDFEMPAADATLTANFDAIPVYTLTLAVNPDGTGTVTGAGDYTAGTQVAVTATPNEGYIFLNWTDAGGNEVSSEANFTYTMPAADVTLTANFDLEDFVDEITASMINVFPNPTRDFFSITAPGMILHVVVTDISGKVVYNTNVNNEEVRISASSFEPGIYLVRIHTEDGVFLKKLQVQ